MAQISLRLRSLEPVAVLLPQVGASLNGERRVRAASSQIRGPASACATDAGTPPRVEAPAFAPRAIATYLAFLSNTSSGALGPCWGPCAAFAFDDERGMQ